MSGDSYVRQVQSIDESLTRLNHKVKELRKKKKEAEERLYVWMQRNGHEKYDKYTIQKLQPKPKSKRKPKKEKRQDAIKLFSDIGIDDPESFLQEFERTQKYIENVENDDGENDET